MSYILDAFNKSEQRKDRDQDAWPQYRPSARGAPRFEDTAALADHCRP